MIAKPQEPVPRWTYALYECPAPLFIMQQLSTPLLGLLRLLEGMLCNRCKALNHSLKE